MAAGTSRRNMAAWREGSSSFRALDQRRLVHLDPSLVERQARARIRRRRAVVCRIVDLVEEEHLLIAADDVGDVRHQLLAVVNRADSRSPSEAPAASGCRTPIELTLSGACFSSGTIDRTPRTNPSGRWCSRARRPSTRNALAAASRPTDTGSDARRVLPTDSGGSCSVCRMRPTGRPCSSLTRPSTSSASLSLSLSAGIGTANPGTTTASGT